LSNKFNNLTPRRETFCLVKDKTPKKIKYNYILPNIKKKTP